MHKVLIRLVPEPQNGSNTICPSSVDAALTNEDIKYAIKKYIADM